MDTGVKNGLGGKVGIWDCLWSCLTLPLFFATCTAKLQLPIPQWHPSGIVKLSQRDFQTYMELVVSELTGDEDELLDNIVEFLMMAVERTHAERLRGSARRKWLLKMEHAAMTNGGCIKPVYDVLFKVLCRVSVSATVFPYMERPMCFGVFHFGEED